MAKKKAKLESGKPEQTRKNRQENVIIGIVVGVLLLLIISVILVSSSSHFKYLGLEFKKEKYGNLLIYSANVPIIDARGNITSYVPLDLRNDPRTLRDILVNTSGYIGFLKGVDTYISMNPYMESCEDNGIALGGLGIFFSRAGVPIKAAFNNKSYAEPKGDLYITCQNATTNTVLIVDSGNETRITKIAENCFKIEFNNCEILKATEKLQLLIVEQYMVAQEK